jgi:hypothetical protein
MGLFFVVFLAIKCMVTPGVMDFSAGALWELFWVEYWKSEFLFDGKKEAPIW